jgi:hypothetical protein
MEKQTATVQPSKPKRIITAATLVIAVGSTLTGIGMVTHLRKTIDDKERQISTLKDKLNAKDKKIRALNKSVHDCFESHEMDEALLRKAVPALEECKVLDGE